jgi:5'-nucleotidase
VALVPVAVADASSTVVVPSSRVEFGQPVTIPVEVTASSGSATGGTVTLKLGSTVLGTATVQTNGVARVVVPAKKVRPGRHTVTATYGGRTGVAPGSGQGVLTVDKGTVRITAAISGPIRVDRTRASVAITVTNPDGVAVAGTVSVVATGVRIQTVRLVGGKATLRLPVFPTRGLKTVTVRYDGSPTLELTKVTRTVTVVR